MPPYAERRRGLLAPLILFSLLAMPSPAAPAQDPAPANTDRAAAQPAKIAIAIHGGAGTIRREDMTPELERQYRDALESALLAGHKILADGGTAMDAVEAAVVVMEDSPLFNAGKGGVFTSAGTVELDACLMDGQTLKAGAVAGVTRIKNPIRAARAVMEKTPHVMLAADGADRFAEEVGLDIVPNEYFHTERRRKALEEAQRRERERGARVVGIGEGREDAANDLFFTPDVEGKFGTVGCVALDRHGNLAAATSTGGLTNKRFGRIGDTPIVGAGNYAENATCAVSGTGQGEFFMRLLIAGDVAARMRYAGESLQEASASQMRRMSEMSAQGGLIALGRDGRVAFAFNTEGMYRGVIDEAGKPRVAIYGDGEDRIPGDLPGNGGTRWDAAFGTTRPSR